MAKKTAREELRKRIVDHGDVDPETIKPHPLNYRVHTEEQRELVRELMQRLGSIDSLMVNRRTGLLVDGHLRRELAVELGWQTVPVEFIELSDEEERLALATHDEVTALAASDATIQAELLAQMQAGEGELAVWIEAMAAEAQATADMLDFDGDREPWRGREFRTTPDLVKIIVRARQLAVIEAALQITGLGNRGDALAAICRSYLEQSGAIDMLAEAEEIDRGRLDD